MKGMTIFFIQSVVFHQDPQDSRCLIKCGICVFCACGINVNVTVKCKYISAINFHLCQIWGEKPCFCPKYPEIFNFIKRFFFFLKTFKVGGFFWYCFSVGKIKPLVYVKAKACFRYHMHVTIQLTTPLCCISWRKCRRSKARQYHKNSEHGEDSSCAVVDCNLLFLCYS